MNLGSIFFNIGESSNSRVEGHGLFSIVFMTSVSMTRSPDLSGYNSKLLDRYFISLLSGFTLICCCTDFELRSEIWLFLKGVF